MSSSEAMLYRFGRRSSKLLPWANVRMSSMIARSGKMECSQDMRSIVSFNDSVKVTYHNNSHSGCQKGIARIVLIKLWGAGHSPPFKPVSLLESLSCIRFVQPLQLYNAFHSAPTLVRNPVEIHLVKNTVGACPTARLSTDVKAFPNRKPLVLISSPAAFPHQIFLIRKIYICPTGKRFSAFQMLSPWRSNIILLLICCYKSLNLWSPSRGKKPYIPFRDEPFRTADRCIDKYDGKKGSFSLSSALTNG